MPSYSEDRRWSDRFISEIKRIVGPYLLEESSFEVDTQQASDLIVMKANGVTVACRVRRPEYYKYRYDFTIRSMRDSGAETEQVKIYNGWADWMFYGHAVPDCDVIECPGFRGWMLLNLDSYRSQMITYQSQIIKNHKSNRDGTYFNVYDIRGFKPHPPLLIGSQGIFTETIKPNGADASETQLISHCQP